MAELWKAANSGDWHQFIKLYGGTSVEKKEFIVSVAKKWNDKPNRYQEPWRLSHLRGLWQDCDCYSPLPMDD